MLRSSTLLIAALLGIIVATPCFCADGQPTLLGILAQWRYPGSKISGATMQDAATVNSKGERTAPSIQCKTVMTTEDAMDKVVRFYEDKLNPEAKEAIDPKEAKPEEKPAADVGQSVTTHEDSEGRPVTLHIISVNNDKSSTTLVISRADDEAQTHIAWTRYLRLD